MANLSESTRDTILAAARELFARYGLSKTTVEDIARAVHMGKGSLYYYFKSKEDLFKAVLDSEIDALREEMKTALTKDVSPLDKMKIYLSLRIKGLKNFVNVYNTFRDDYLNNFAFIRKIRSEYDAYEIATVRSILQEGIEKRLFHIKDVDLTSFTIVSAVKGLEYEWAIAVDQKETERNMEKMLEVLFYGIVKR
jgi:AcrR family transcriptional regulator